MLNKIIIPIIIRNKLITIFDLILEYPSINKFINAGSAGKTKMDFMVLKSL